MAYHRTYRPGAIAAYSSGSFAQDAVVTPGGAVVVPEGTEIRIPWGAWLSELSSTVATLLFAIVLWLFRRLPGSVVAILQTMRAEQLIQKAIDYGLNATAGAAKDKVLTINVGNEVLAKAITYAIENGAPYIVKWLGGQGRDLVEDRRPSRTRAGGGRRG